MISLLPYLYLNQQRKHWINCGMISVVSSDTNRVPCSPYELTNSVTHWCLKALTDSLLLRTASSWQSLRSCPLWPTLSKTTKNPMRRISIYFQHEEEKLCSLEEGRRNIRTILLITGMHRSSWSSVMYFNIFRQLAIGRSSSASTMSILGPSELRTWIASPVEPTEITIESK